MVRIGVIGAGGFTRNRLLPNLVAVPGAEIAAIATKTLANAERVAAAFGVPMASDDWHAVVESDKIDAVLVATQPNMHHEIVMASLRAGKHVLCQTRMATSVAEAREMLSAAEDHGLKHMMVRSGSYLEGSTYVRHLLATGFVGQVRQAFCHYLTPDVIDGGAPLGRRQDHHLYGVINPLHVGIDFDAVHPWFGDPARVLAWGKTFTQRRQETADGAPFNVEMPDAVTIVAEINEGPIVTFIQSGVTSFGQDRIEIYGEEGTLVYDRRKGLFGARKSDDALGPMPIPEEHRDRWQVESDFIKLVRGEIPKGSPDFADGVKNMEFLQAAHTSRTEERWVDLPLD